MSDKIGPRTAKENAFRERLANHGLTAAEIEQAMATFRRKRNIVDLVQLGAASLAALMTDWLYYRLVNRGWIHQPHRNELGVMVFIVFIGIACIDTDRLLHSGHLALRRVNALATDWNGLLQALTVVVGVAAIVVMFIVAH